jgi:nucleolar protein 15
MNHYLLMGHLLRCNVIPSSEVHPELWVGANKKWRMVPRARLEKVRQDKVSRARE